MNNEINRLIEKLRHYDISINEFTEELRNRIEEGFTPVVGSICSAHQKPNKDCELCKVHFPFSIDTDKYCRSANYIPLADAHKYCELDEEKVADVLYDTYSIKGEMIKLSCRGLAKALSSADILTKKGE